MKVNLSQQHGFLVEQFAMGLKTGVLPIALYIKIMYKILTD